MRQREELSITIAPAAANRGAHSPEVEPPAEKSAMSKPWIDSSSEPLHDQPALELAPGRALGGERHDLRRRELALAQQPQHQRAHLPGGAHDRDSIAVAHACVRVTRALEPGTRRSGAGAAR